MAHMEITRELARQFLEQMVNDGLFRKVGIYTWDMFLCTPAPKQLWTAVHQR